MTDFCSVPYIYTLEITSACNAHCLGCGNVFPRGNLHITAENCQCILERISPHAEMLRITGGEPTLSPTFSEILQALDRLGKPIVVFTNGLWEQPPYIIEVLRSCQNLDGILVSLHGHSASAHKAFTGVDHFSTVVANIQRASKADILVNTNTILTRKNIYHMPKVVELATQAGAQVVAFSRYYGVPIPGLTDLSAEELKFAVQQVVSLRAAGRTVKFNNNIPLCLGGELTQACPAGDTHCTISPTCKVRVCNHSPYEVGDILETPIEQIWRSDRVRRWREQVPAMCTRCVAFDLCRGGCRANAQANGQSADPAACGPYHVRPKLPPPIRHSLDRKSLPRACFSVHQESFGYVLITRSQILKVTHDAKPLIDALMDGTMTLSRITNLFGQTALNFIGLLYDRHMLELTSGETLLQ
jgi:radical SAM protein with 4Fe4S-binding SPASM domain